MLKIFGTDGIRSKVNTEPMTPDTCLKIARAAGFILSEKDKINRVIISKDTRCKQDSGCRIQGSARIQIRDGGEIRASRLSVKRGPDPFRLRGA